MGDYTNRDPERTNRPQAHALNDVGSYLSRYTCTQRPRHTAFSPPSEQSQVEIVSVQAFDGDQIPSSTATSPPGSEAAAIATVLPGTKSSTTVTPGSPTTTTGSSTAAIKTKDLFTSTLLAGGLQSVQQEQQAGAPSAPKGVCFASDMPELLEALDDDSGCSIINLVILADESNGENGNDTPFIFENEVLVSSRVVIQGNSVVLPLLDCSSSIRCFRVLTGGYLELRYVRINQSNVGVLRPVRPLLEGITPTGMVKEYRGSSVYFESDATGGRFLGVIFDDDQSDEFEQILEESLALTSNRIYGGFIFMAGGRLEFELCLFWDFEYMTPLDRIYVGGDVLVLAGEVSFIGCVWIYTTFFGLENGAGFNIALLGGVATYTLCEFAEINGFLGMNGVGQAFMVAGGVQVLTGCSLTYFSIAAFFSGTGEMTVFGGAIIAVGTSLVDAYGLLASFGAGMDYCVTAGLLVHIGSTVKQYSGPLTMNMVGGYSFLGTGTYVGIGSPALATVTTIQESGTGGTWYNAAGVSTFIGCSITEFTGISAANILGEFAAVSAGLLIWIGSPFIEYSGIEYFKGLGGTAYVGTGAAVFGYSPLVEAIGIVNPHTDFWIQGSCESYEGEWASGPLFFVTGSPPGNCQDHVATPPPERRIEREVEEGAREDEEGAVGLLGMVGEERREFFNSLFRNSAKNEMKGGRRTRHLSSSLFPSSEGGEREEEKDIGLWIHHSKTRQMNFSDSKMRQLMVEEYHVPPLILQAAEAMQLALQRGEKKRERGKTGGVYLSSPPQGSCRVCGIEYVEGPGAKACVVDEECKEEGWEWRMLRHGMEEKEEEKEEEDNEWFSNAFPSVPSSSSSSTSSFVEYKEQFIILGDVHITSSSYPPSPPPSFNSSALVETAFRHALLSLIPSLDVRPQSLQITVWSAEPDTFFVPSPPPSLLSPSMYKFIVVATDTDNATAITDTLSFSSSSFSSSSLPPSPSSPPSFPEVILAFMQKRGKEGGEKGGVGQVEVAVEKTMHIPAYNSNGFLQQEQAWKEGWMKGGKEGGRRITAWAEEENGEEGREDEVLFSISLRDPSLPALPLTHLTYDHPYSLHLRGFSPSDSVKLQLLLSGCGRGREEVGEVRVLGEVLMDARGHGGEKRQTVIFVEDKEGEGREKEGEGVIVMQVPAGDVSLALQAVDILTGGVGFSASMVVSREGRKRRLYGPLVEY